MEIWIDMIPPKTTSQQKRACITGGGKIRFFKGKKLEQAEDDLFKLLSGYSRVVKIAGAVKVTLIPVFPYRKSEKKSVIDKTPFIPMTSKPDLDNFSKIVLDTMTRLAFFEDDAKVVCEVLEKYWGPKPGLYIKIEQYEQKQLPKLIPR